MVVQRLHRLARIAFLLGPGHDVVGLFLHPCLLAITRQAFQGLIQPGAVTFVRCVARRQLLACRVIVLFARVLAGRQLVAQALFEFGVDRRLQIGFGGDHVVVHTQPGRRGGAVGQAVVGALGALVGGQGLIGGPHLLLERRGRLVGRHPQLLSGVDQVGVGHLVAVGVGNVVGRHAGVRLRHVGERLAGLDHVGRRLLAIAHANRHVDLLADLDLVGVLDLRVGRLDHRHRRLVAVRDLGQRFAALHLVLHIVLGRRGILLSLMQRRRAHRWIDLLARRWRRGWRRRRLNPAAVVHIGNGVHCKLSCP